MSDESDASAFDPAPFDPERFEAGMPPRPSERRPGLALLPVLALLAVLFVVPVPYFLVTPGPAEDVIPLIHISGHQTYPTEEHLLLTTVGFDTANAYQALWALVAPNRELFKESDFLAPGESTQQQQQRSLSDMDTSKIDAAIVALTKYAGYPKNSRPGVLIEYVQPGLPADGRLFAGDLIVSVNGTAIQGPVQLGTMIDAAGVGHALTFTVRAGGKTRTERVASARVKGFDHPIIGINPVNNFPFPLTISSGRIGGPSAGLMWTLGLVDLLTPGDLTGGRVIAGTGGINLDGTVFPIGGVKEKVVAAERAGAKVFFVPQTDYPDAKVVADGITVVAVKTYLDAVNYLRTGPAPGGAPAP